MTRCGHFGKRREVVDAVVPFVVPVVLCDGANPCRVSKRVCAVAHFKEKGLLVDGLSDEDRDGRREVHAHAVEDAFGMGLEVVVDSETDLSHGRFFSYMRHSIQQVWFHYQAGREAVKSPVAGIFV